MNMHSQLDAIDLILRKDETLLRLLYYKSEYFSDDPLDNDKPNILELDNSTDIINHRIKYTPVTKDFVDSEICRIIFYPAPRRAQNNNYMVANQLVNFDIFVHQGYNDVDMRLSKICDRINELFSHKQTTGLGKSKFADGNPFTLSDKGYIGYTMVYSFGDVNA